MTLRYRSLIQGARRLGAVGVLIWGAVATAFAPHTTDRRGRASAATRPADSQPATQPAWTPGEYPQETPEQKAKRERIQKLTRALIGSRWKQIKPAPSQFTVRFLDGGKLITGPHNQEGTWHAVEGNQIDVTYGTGVRRIHYLDKNGRIFRSPGPTDPAQFVMELVSKDN